MKNQILIFISLCSLLSCFKVEPKPIIQEMKVESLKRIIYTQPSMLKNEYNKFSSPNAINRLAKIENDYFNAYNDSLKSNYYGTAWSEEAINSFNESDSINDFEIYLNSFEKKPDSMHCTLYAIEALRHGMSGEFEKLEARHKVIWGNREHAGWSIGYILTKYYDWKAFLIVSKSSPEYNSCIRNFKRDKKYHVWKQPNIPIEKLYVLENKEEEIDSVLSENEFGWGFSYQGYHTWVSRFDTLKECNWFGVPAIKYKYGYDMPLFEKSKFIEYADYGSHVVIFPPKKSLKD